MVMSVSSTAGVALPPVPMVDLVAAHLEVADEVRAGFDAVMATTSFVDGAEVALFEEEFAAFCGTRRCVGVANGTDALELTLRAAGVAAGDEVILPANTFNATAGAVCRAGATPVFVDVDDATLLVDPAAVRAAIGPRTTALVPVHLFGQLAPMDELAGIAERNGLLVVEDAAQAHGATAGGVGVATVGRAATFSFYPGKNLGAYGDAGAVVTDDEALADAVRRSGHHGSEQRYVHDDLGFNSRLDTMQAVVLRAKLRRLATWNAARARVAATYDALLADLDGVRRPVVAPGNSHVWHLYVVRVADRDRVLAHLRAHGVGAAVHYPVPLHRQPAFAGRGTVGAGGCAVADRAAGELLSLPIHPHLGPGDAERVVAVLSEAVRS